jgi:hypoxanthine phosphoribosyltransferase
MDSLVEAHGLKFKPMIAEEAIQEKIKEMGAAISKDYEGKRPLLIGILNGAFIFAADLMRAISIDCEISFIKLASYRGLTSTENVSTLIGLEVNVKDRHVILVEDIVDSGKTLSAFIPELKKSEPASVALASLLVKPESIKHPVQIDYQGFEIPPAFVIGYGLDYNGLARNLSGIYQLAE